MLHELTSPDLLDPSYQTFWAHLTRRARLISSDIVGSHHHTCWAPFIRHGELTSPDMLGSPYQTCWAHLISRVLDTSWDIWYPPTLLTVQMNIQKLSQAPDLWMARCRRGFVRRSTPPASAVAEDDIPISPPTNSQKRREFSVSPCWGIVRRGATDSFHYRKDSSDGKVPQK
jgi:hypothetical protein